jgi:epsilon-lactone hydrolase
MHILRTLTFFYILSGCTVLAESNDEVWQIGTRSLPPPAGASQVLHNAIGALPAPDVARTRNAFDADKVDWPVLARQRRAAQQMDLNQLATRMDVVIEPGKVNGIPTYSITPNTMAPVLKDAIFIYVHGGAYVFGGGTRSASEAATISHYAGIRSIAIDYRMPPDHPFPAAVDDVVTVYKHIIEETPPGQVAIGGTSAGGGLSLASVHKFRELGLPFPGAIYGGTPWADLTKTGDSLFTNEGIDRVLVTYDALLGGAARLYASGHDLKDPLISPVYGDFSEFPPTYLVTGTRDMFLSDTARTHRKLRMAGVVAELNVYEGMSHAEYAFLAQSPESQQVYSELAAFLRQHLR